MEQIAVAAIDTEQETETQSLLQEVATGQEEERM
jgi:hypothetical protein